MVLFDLQGIQSSAHGERGIARYLLNLAQALERRHPGVISSYLLNSSLPVPATAEPMLATGRVMFSDRAAESPARIFHIGSPFEYAPLGQLAPRYAHAGGMRLVVTLYDLIPKLFPDIYLSNPVSSAWYGARLELVRQADRVLAISQATADDAVKHLGLPAARVVTVGAGVSERFAPPGNREEAFAALRHRLQWIEPEYVLYTGGIEPRKNIDRLLEAYARLSEPLRAQHQLVVVCRVLPAELAKLRKRLRNLGVADRVHFPGFVSDAELVLLYQACGLFVFPSIYEGFGLPIAEAMACGAPVASARTSSLVELVRDDEALFNPLEVQSINAALERCLGNGALLERLRGRHLEERHTWHAVAARTAAVYEELASLPRKPRRRRPRIAFVSPLPPQRSGIADYSYRLLKELVELCDVDAFVDETPERVLAPRGVVVEGIWRLPMAERARAGYSRVIYALGNSEHHAAALAMLRRRPGTVLAHDVRLTGLYSWCAANRSDLEPRGFHGALRSMYDGRIPLDVGSAGGLSYEEADRYGIYMAREAIAQSERYLVHSRYAQQIAQLDALPQDADKAQVLGFAFPSPEEFPREEPRHPIVATFGLVAPVKQTEKVVKAFAQVAAVHSTATLAVVGPAGAKNAVDACVRLAEDLGIGGRVQVTGELNDQDFRSLIGGATVAVQLRETSNGETAASVADCLAAGVPTIVTAIGSARELPDDCVVKLERDVDPNALASEIARLLADDARRAVMQDAGQLYARSNSFEKIAKRLYRTVVLDEPDSETSEGPQLSASAF